MPWTVEEKTFCVETYFETIDGGGASQI